VPADHALGPLGRRALVVFPLPLGVGACKSSTPSSLKFRNLVATSSIRSRSCVTKRTAPFPFPDGSAGPLALLYLLRYHCTK
jgi:hypothetical protein